MENASLWGLGETLNLQTHGLSIVEEPLRCPGAILPDKQFEQHGPVERVWCLELQGPPGWGPDTATVKLLSLHMVPLSGSQFLENNA